jgi:serine/threonine-protein kinase
LREAKIQARLDHPAIVPVHELGADSEGRPYFTMKRIPSATLHDQLERRDVPLQRLLRAFVDVCLAVEFAHARGFVHRDLKPSNVSLGDYGEVYVLDWGIARSLGDTTNDLRDRDITTLEGATQVGALLGTPGYMAPEQARGEPVGTAADVYALGCMLFEILAGEALHPRGTQAAMSSTIAEPAQSPATRKPDRTIAPELDAACIAALAGDPAHRPRAGELADRIQAYLDGDRDVEHRRTLAGDELAAARTLAAEPAGRADAIRRAGRALALDPESRDAAAFVVKLLVEPPEQLPPELDRELREQQAEQHARTAGTASRAALSYLAFAPFVILVGVRSWTAFAAMYVAVFALYGHSLWQSRTRRVRPEVPLVINIAMMAVLSTMMSPFLFVPAVICIFAMTTTTHMGMWQRPVAALAGALAAFLLPVALQAFGVMQQTWSIEPGRLEIVPSSIEIGGPGTMVLLLVANLGAIVVAAVFARSMARSRDSAQRQLEIQAWHLRKLLPVETPRPAVPAIACH